MATPSLHWTWIHMTSPLRHPPRPKSTPVTCYPVTPPLALLAISQDSLSHLDLGFCPYSFGQYQSTLCYRTLTPWGQKNMFSSLLHPLCSAHNRHALKGVWWVNYCLHEWIALTLKKAHFQNSCWCFVTEPFSLRRKNVLPRVIETGVRKHLGPFPVQSISLWRQRIRL